MLAELDYIQYLVSLTATLFDSIPLLFTRMHTHSHTRVTSSPVSWRTRGDSFLHMLPWLAWAIRVQEVVTASLGTAPNGQQCVSDITSASATIDQLLGTPAGRQQVRAPRGNCRNSWARVVRWGRVDRELRAAISFCSIRFGAHLVTWSR